MLLIGKQIDETRLLEQLINQKRWTDVEEDVTFLRLRHALANKTIEKDGNSSDEDPSASPAPRVDSDNLLCAVAARRRAGLAAAEMLKNAPGEMAQDVARQKAFAEVLAFCRTRWQLLRFGSRYQIQLFPGTEQKFQMTKTQEADDEDEVQKKVITSDGAHAYLNLSLVRGTELTFAHPWGKFIKTGKRLHVRVLGEIHESRNLVPATKKSSGCNLNSDVFVFKELDDSFRQTIMRKTRSSFMCGERGIARCYGMAAPYHRHRLYPSFLRGKQHFYYLQFANKSTPIFVFAVCLSFFNFVHQGTC